MLSGSTKYPIWPTELISLEKINQFIQRHEIQHGEVTVYTSPASVLAAIMEHFDRVN